MSKEPNYGASCRSSELSLVVLRVYRYMLRIALPLLKITESRLRIKQQVLRSGNENRK
jgi:hypothetical protein